MREQHAEQRVDAVARDDDERPLHEPRQHVLERHRRDDDAGDRPLGERGVAGDEHRVGGAEHGAERRRDERDVLGDRVDGHVGGDQRLRARR